MATTRDIHRNLLREHTSAAWYMAFSYAGPEHGRNTDEFGMEVTTMDNASIEVKVIAGMDQGVPEPPPSGSKLLCSALVMVTSLGSSQRVVGATDFWNVGERFKGLGFVRVSVRGYYKGSIRVSIKCLSDYNSVAGYYLPRTCCLGFPSIAVLHIPPNPTLTILRSSWFLVFRFSGL